MPVSYADSFPDIAGVKYDTDIDSLFRFTGSFDGFAIYVGNGKWKAYALDYINIFTDLSPVNHDGELKAEMKAIDNAVGGH